MKTIISYQERKVFIGIDVHRKTYSVCAFCEGEIVKRCRMVADPEKLARFILKHFPGAELQTVYEAGFCGFVLHRVLEGRGIANIVINAASIETASNNRVRTDKRDAKKMASQLAAGRLRGIRIPSVADELSRLHARTRGQLMGARKRVMNQIRMRLHYFGLFPIEHQGVLSLKLIKEVRAQGLAKELDACLESKLSILLALNAEIRKLQCHMREQAKENPFEQTYLSLPGIGFITARVLASELGNLQQFPNERALFCFTGLTPSENSSGDTIRRGHISRQGSSRLRHLLVEAAWRAIKKDPGLKATFERISVRAGKKRAIVAIARKLIGRGRAVFRTETKYDATQSLTA